MSIAFDTFELLYLDLVLKHIAFSIQNLGDGHLFELNASPLNLIPYRGENKNHSY